MKQNKIAKGSNYIDFFKFIGLKDQIGSLDTFNFLYLNVIWLKMYRPPIRKAYFSIILLIKITPNR